MFTYLDERERTLDSPTEKLLLSAAGYADEMERARARQRTADALAAKFARGHVVGGTVFGYTNRAVLRSDGSRSHVVREIEPDEAAAVRRIFTWYADGAGCKAIAKRLNDAGALCPKPRRQVQRGWAPSSVRVVLYNELYRGEIIWGRVQRRDRRFGHERPTARPPEQSRRAHNEALRIIDEPLWEAAHARLARQRATYLRHSDGRLWGRPVNGAESPYLLTGMSACGVCGASLYVLSTKAQGIGKPKLRRFVYRCQVHVQRGTAVCANTASLPMVATDQAILDAVEAHMLDPAIVERAILLAIRRPLGAAGRDAFRGGPPGGGGRPRRATRQAHRGREALRRCPAGARARDPDRPAPSRCRGRGARARPGASAPRSGRAPSRPPGARDGVAGDGAPQRAPGGDNCCGSFSWGAWCSRRSRRACTSRPTARLVLFSTVWLALLEK